MDACQRMYYNYHVTQADVDKKCIPLNSSIISVVRMIKLGGYGATKGNLFDFRYQYALNDLYTFGSNMSMQSFWQTLDYLASVEWVFNQEKTLRFNRHMNELYIDMDWKRDIAPGDYLVFDCYQVVDPEAYPDVYNDAWLKSYVTALFKQQWGTDLKKWDQVAIPGGVKLNGQKIYDEATSEIKELMIELDTRYTPPPRFFVG